MKLAPLLAEYLYQNKHLHLPGIGIFRIQTPAYIDPDLKQSKYPAEEISFTDDHSLKENESLIAFISEQTGKMKALAGSDLSSFLELTTQFLNIGKPFELEGIGTLVKVKSGEYEFIPANVSADRSRDAPKEISATATNEESFTGYNEMFSTAPKKMNMRKPLAVLLILAGIGVTIWAGYAISKRSASSAETNALESYVEPAPVDSSALMAKKDTVVAEKTGLPPGHYKFVLETAGRKRAFDRFAALKSYHWPVQLETSDSVTFKIFMVIPSTPADSAWKKDSLRIRSGRSVYIER